MMVKESSPFYHRQRVTRMRSSFISRCVNLRLRLFTVACMFQLLPGVCENASAQNSHQRNTLLFVDDVMNKLEYRDSGGSRVTKWANAPKVSVFGNHQRHRSIVEATLNEINKALPNNFQIKRLSDEASSATMKIYFVNLADFNNVAKQHNFKVVAGNRGYFYIRWNGDFEIQEATILIAEDKLSGNSLKHYLLEETVQSLGLGGDSKRFPNSIFYEDNQKSNFGTATRLTQLDRKLVRFLYTDVPAGSTPIEVGQIFEKRWK